MRLTVIAILVGALGAADKDLEKKLEELEIRSRIETSSVTALLTSAKYSENSGRD